MNRPAASSKAHVTLARRPGDVPVLPWSKIRRIPSTRLGENDRSTTIGPNYYLQSIGLALAANAAANSNIHHRQIERLILPDLKNGERTPSQVHEEARGSKGKLCTGGIHERSNSARISGFFGSSLLRGLVCVQQGLVHKAQTSFECILKDHAYTWCQAMHIDVRDGHDTGWSMIAVG